MLESVLAGALRFRGLLVAAALGVIVLGALSLRSMPSDVVPELASGPVLEVQTEALGLSSQEVEQYVTVPLENNLLDGVMDVWDVRSQSIPGLSTVNLYFEPGTSTLHARQLVEERLTNAFSLPNVSKPPQLIQPMSSTARVMLIGLRTNTLSPIELSYLARWIVKPRIAGVAGVANVAIFGQQDRQIQVQVDPRRLAARHIQLSQIIDTAGNAQLVSPLTYLEGSAPGTGGFLDGPNQRLEVRPVLPLGAPHDLASVPVTDVKGRLPLGNVTRVVQGHQPLIGNALVGGQSGLVLEVQKLPSASVLGVTKGIDRALADLRPALGGVQINTSFFRPATYVSDALHNLKLALLISAGLMLLALIALLLDARTVLVAAVSVVVSMMSAALLLQALGYTLNALVTLGLFMAAILVVDDAVGTTQQIAARMGSYQGDSAPVTTRAVVVGTCLQLRGTLGYATFIALAAAAPVFFAHGLSATFVHPMLLAFALSLIASSVVAMTLTPALGMLAFERGGWRRRSVRPAEYLARGYQWLILRALKVPRALLACVCLLGLAGLVAIPFLQLPARPSFKDRNLVVSWSGPAGSSLGEMDRVTARVVDQLKALPGVADVGATLGRAVSADQIVDTNSGEIFVALRPRANYSQAVAQVRQITEGTPGIHASVGTYEDAVTDGVLAPAHHDVTVRIYGEDYNQLRNLSWQVRVAMSHAKGVGFPQVKFPVTEPNIEVAVNDAAALRAGVLPGDARREASTLVSGLTVGNFFQEQAVFDVVVVGQPSVRDSVQSVSNLLIDTSGGRTVRLGQIARVSVRSDPIDIQHEALSRYVDVTAPVTNGSAGAAAQAVQRTLSQVRFPLQYHPEILGGTPDDPTSHLVFLSYVAAALVGILLLMQAALRSWRLAAMLFLGLPVALAGALIVALAAGETSSLGTYGALLAVLVFAVRQGLLEIDHIRRMQRRDGGPLTTDHVRAAAGERLGPALGSTAVCAVGLLPFIVMGNVAGNELIHTAAAVMLGGLVSSIILNLLLVPAMCLRLGPSGPIVSGDPLEELAEAQELVLSTPSGS
jgi:Cu/Ag efflux pump CusA